MRPREEIGGVGERAWWREAFALEHDIFNSDWAFFWSAMRKLGRRAKAAQTAAWIIWASGSDWRPSPLRGHRFVAEGYNGADAFLYDGRARNFIEAICGRR